eukprot:GFKZ01014140.1.p1 GENE.GFKZ01014140.1~~GFKZ01014140.1.p1  ORF type:complete len:863 (+),score=76.48 GFKZ01014140.1:309-2897(+)
MDLKEFSAPLPNGITVNHLELHNVSVRENRPIIEFEYNTGDEDELTLTVFGRERPGLLADLTAYLESTTLSIMQASIYTLPNGAIMDQFKLKDPNHILQDDDELKRIHDTLVDMVSQKTPKTQTPHRRFFSRSSAPIPPALSHISSSQSKDHLYNYAMLRHRVPISLLAPRGAQRSGLSRRFSSNIALTELEEEQRIERERERKKSEAVTANFVEDAISSLVDGDFLYYYSSGNRYRHRFSLSDDKTHLCWGESSAIRLSRYAGVLFGPKSATFQDLGPRLVDPEWLCFSIVSNPPVPIGRQVAADTRLQTIDLVCVSVDQLNRWLLGLQSLCRPHSPHLLPRHTLHDLVRMRVIYKIRAHAHARGLTVRRYFLKRVQEAGRRRSSMDANRQHVDEVKQLEAELARLQKTLIDSARRETLLNSSLRDFQHSWEVDYGDIEFLHPIGQGAFSEMWKGFWRSTPVAIKRLTAKSTLEPTVPRSPQTPVPAMTTMGMGQPRPQVAALAAATRDDPLQRVQRLDGTDMSPDDRRLMHDFRLEVTMLSKLRHPNIVLFLGACTRLPQMCILTEFCHGGSLFAALRKRSWRTCLSLQDLRNVARHLARGMRYLHACRIIHRDLKSQNLLLDRPVEEGCPVVKVADFGLSRNFRGIGTVSGSVAGIMTSETGTYRWMAPEMIRHEPYNEKVDVYSYGVVLWELFSCEVPFAGMTPIQAAFAVADKHLRPMCESTYAREVKIPASWAALISQCWHPSSHERPRFSQVLKILDEMDHCSENEIPKFLRDFGKRNRFQHASSPRPGVIGKIAVMRPNETCEQSVDDGIMEDMSALELAESINDSGPRGTKGGRVRHTGLGHSGSAPNLRKVK